MAVINRFNNTLRGGLYQVGNTIGLYSTATSGVGNLTTATPAPPSGGTTTSYTTVSNAINVQVPSGTVVYAELTWCCGSSTPTQSLPSAATINNSIFIKDPLGVTNTVAINPATTQSGGTVAPGQWAAYTQSVNITSIIQNGGNGFYTLSQIPAVIGGTGSGFSINIVYRDTSLPFRNINIWSLFDGPAIGSTLNVPLTGFSTPSSGNVTGRLTIGTQNANSEHEGDFVRFGPSVATAVTLSGPNNPATNFFCSQINNNAGTLDTSGTFGNSNATPGLIPQTGARTWYDVTNVDVSSGLTNNQTSAQIVLGTVNDYYTVAALGLQIDVNSAQLSPVTKTSNNYFANINDTITYTVTFGNTGLVSANSVQFIDTIPNGLSFIQGTVNVNGTTQGAFNPNPPGFNIGDVGSNSRVTISFKAIVTTIPSPNPTPNQASLGYSFISAPGLSKITASDSSNIVQTKVNHVDVGLTKQVSKAYANVGDILTYTIVIGTYGNTTANTVVFSDTIPNGTSFELGSMTQNGATLTGNPNPPGVSLNSIGINKVSTISFKIKVDTIPNPNPIQNSATTTYSYLVDPTLARNDSGSGNSNTVNTKINNANLVNIVKYVDRSYANCGDTISYTIVVPNTGNVTAQNVVYRDTIPNGTTLLSESLKINGNQITNPNLTTGVTVPNIPPNTTTTITYSVLVNC